MILPIVAYGNPVLRKVCDDITPQYPDLNKLISDMWETMYHSKGVGLAAPQINKPIRLFVIDTAQIVQDFEEEDKKQFPDERLVKKVFINARILEEFGGKWAYNEGCLSIPKVREDVQREARLRISYLDEHFQPQEEEFFGIAARVIQHEYDHIQGKLFIDYLSQLKRRLIRKRLEEISAGRVKTDYKMLLPKERIG